MFKITSFAESLVVLVDVRRESRLEANSRKPRTQKLCAVVNILLKPIDRKKDSLGRRVPSGGTVSDYGVECSNKLVNLRVVCDSVTELALCVALCVAFIP